MVCEVKVNTIKYLENNGATDDVRRIIDRDKFDLLNRSVTSYAIKKFGLETNGDLLFSIETSTAVDLKGSTSIRDTTFKINRALPNDILFDQLQKLKDQVENIESENVIIPESKGITLQFNIGYDENSFGLDVLQDGIRVGAVNYVLANGVAVVDAVEIDPDYRNQGIASEVYAQLAKSLNKNNVVLRSGDLNDNSTPLWKSLVKKGLAKRIAANQYEYISGATNEINNLQIRDEMPLVDMDIKALQDARAKEVAEVLALRLAQGLKTDFQKVSVLEAQKLLRNRKVPYRGEPAFYFAGAVYIVGDNVSVNTVLHEFSHPLLQGIRKTNPKLFKNLYDQLMATDEGQGVKSYVIKNYPELEVDSDLFIEESLAFGLQLKAVNQVVGQIETEGFEGFINKLLAAIKNMLRGIFGNKVTVSKLNENTTLNELAEMLLEKDFVFETDMVTEEDLVMYGRFVKERSDELVKLSNPDAMQKIVEQTYNTNRLVLNEAKKFRGDKVTYKMMQEALFKKGSTEFIEQIRESLKGYMDFSGIQDNTPAEIFEKVIDAEEMRLQDMKNKATALVNSVDSINSITQNMLLDINRISKENINNRHIIGLLRLYKESARSYMSMITDIDKILTQESFVDTNNPFYQTINEIVTNITRVQKNIADILKDNNVQFFVEITSYMNDFVTEKLNSNLGIALKNSFSGNELEAAVLGIYNKVTNQTLSNDDITELIKKGVPESILRGFIKEYQDFVINPERIKNALTGNAHDVSWFNRWLESYSSSNDIIVGPLAIFIQDQRTEVENEVWKKSMEFRKILSDLLPKVGFSKMNTMQIRDMMSEKDTIMFFNKETGEPIEKEIWTFLNEFGNGWRYQQDILEYKLEEAKKAGDRNKIASATEALRQFNSDYMWQEFVPEYYEKDNIFKESEIGELAYTVRKQKLAEYNNVVNQFDNELERLEGYSSAQALWREYQQLASLYYEDGTLKVDDPEKGLYDKSIAEVLIKHREGTKDFSHFVPIQGSLQTSYNETVSLLEANGITKGSGEFKKKMREWEKQNIKLKYSDEFYKERNRKFEELGLLQAKMNAVTSSQFDAVGAQRLISDLIYSYRDEFGQPDSTALGEERLRKIKDTEQALINFRAKFDRRTGLSVEDSQELNLLIDKAKKGQIQTGSLESSRYIYLLKLQKNEGIDPEDAVRIKQLISELSDLSNRRPTEYYMDILNFNLSKQNIKEVSEEDVDNYINSADFEKLLNEDENFKSWFELNHVQKEVFDKEVKKNVMVYQRTSANSFIIPRDSAYIETTDVIDTETGEVITIMGVPNVRHSRYEVKNEYRTIPLGEAWTDYIGKYKDNKGNWLPRKFGPTERYSARDARFMSKKYAQISSNPNSAQFKLLEAMKTYHLSNQDGMTNYGKLYLDLPRYATKKLDIYQAFQRGRYGERYKELGANIKEWWSQTWNKSVADYEQNDLNYDPKNNLINTDLDGNQVSYIPVTGIYNLDDSITDADVIQGMFKYALSIQTQGKLTESLPLVESVLSTLEDPANQPKELEAFSKGMFNVRGILQKANKPGASNNRLGQVRSLIQREYSGKNVEGIDETNPRVAKFLSNIQGFSTVSSLAVNIPSALKNQFSGYIQEIIEAAGAEFITLKDLALSTPWATKAMLDWTTKDIYSVGPGSESSQLIQIFDPNFKSTDEFGREVTRSMLKDLVNAEWLYMHRKFGEMSVAVKLFGAFLHGQKVDQRLENGTIKSIRYVDAWEKDANGILKLKKGVHPGWNNTSIYHVYVKGETLEEIAKKYYIDVVELKAKNRIKSEIQLEDGQEIVIAKSEKFKAFKNRLQGTSRRLFGVYDRMGQPEGNKLLIYRMFFFMRKWFTPMFVNRFGMDTKTFEWTRGGERYDWALGKYTKGYYITAFQVLTKVLKSKFRDYQYLTPEEKSDFRRFATEGLTTIMFSVLASMIFGFDPDDDDKWDKLKAKSGAINQDDFNTYGFMSNHMLNLMLGVQAETSAFIPLPSVFGMNLGADDYAKMVTSTSTSWYNTVILYVQMLGDVASFVTFDDMPRYKKDTGPYWWDQKDELQIWNKLFKAVGFTGGSGDPVTSIKNQIQSGSRIGGQ